MGESGLNVGADIPEYPHSPWYSAAGSFWRGSGDYPDRGQDVIQDHVTRAGPGCMMCDLTCNEVSLKNKVSQCFGKTKDASEITMCCRWNCSNSLLGYHEVGHDL